MFSWIQKMIDAVPPDYQATHPPLEKFEKVIGPVPDTVASIHRAGLFHAQKAVEAIMAHRAEPHPMGEGSDAECLRLLDLARLQERRLLLLVDLAREEVLELFQLKENAMVSIRKEGVVLFEPTGQNLVEAFLRVLFDDAGKDPGKSENSPPS